jgi:hypothetical protein
MRVVRSIDCEKGGGKCVGIIHRRCCSNHTHTHTHTHKINRVVDVVVVVVVYRCAIIRHAGCRTRGNLKKTYYAPAGRYLKISFTVKQFHDIYYIV